MTCEILHCISQTLQEVCKHNLKEATLGTHFEIEYEDDKIEDDKIELDIPQGTVEEDGWILDSLVYPMVIQTLSPVNL